MAVEPDHADLAVVEIREGAQRCLGDAVAPARDDWNPPTSQGLGDDPLGVRESRLVTHVLDLDIAEIGEPIRLRKVDVEVDAVSAQLRERLAQAVRPAPRADLVYHHALEGHAQEGEAAALQVGGRYQAIAELCIGWIDDGLDRPMRTLREVRDIERHGVTSLCLSPDGRFRVSIE